MTNKNKVSRLSISYDKKVSKKTKIVINKNINYGNSRLHTCSSIYGYDFVENLKHKYKKKKRIVAIGDIHGDFEMLKKVLLMIKVIDKKDNWIGGETFVVQTGDQVDRCRSMNPGDCSKPNYLTNDKNDDIKILKYLTKLHIKAQEKNGAVISLLGNHEIMNAIGNMSYVSYKGIVGFNNSSDHGFDYGLKKRSKLFRPGNKLAVFLGCTRLSIVIIGSYLFVHASIVSELADKFPNLDGIKNINELIRDWLLRDRKMSDIIPGTNIEIRDLLLKSHSPFLPRNLGFLPPKLDVDDEKCQTQIGDIYNKYNILGIICGHTVQTNEADNSSNISLTCTGTVNKKKTFIARIDAGMSIGFDQFLDKRIPMALEILNDGEEVNILSSNGNYNAFD